MSSSEKCLSRPSVHFLVRPFGCSGWVVGVLYIFWILISHQTHDVICTHFLPSVGCLFFLLMVFFNAWKFSFWSSPVYLLFLYCLPVDVIAKKLLPNPLSWTLSPMFLSKSFITTKAFKKYRLHVSRPAYHSRFSATQEAIFFWHFSVIWG